MDLPYRLPDRRSLYVSLALGSIAAITALVPSWTLKVVLLAPFVVVPSCLWWLLRAGRWLAFFLCGLIMLPPLPIQLGDSGPHPALLIVCFGLLSASVH